MRFVGENGAELCQIKADRNGSPAVATELSVERRAGAILPVCARMVFSDVPLTAKKMPGT